MTLQRINCINSLKDNKIENHYGINVQEISFLNNLIFFTLEILRFLFANLYMSSLISNPLNLTFSLFVNFDNFMSNDADEQPRS